MKMAVYRLREKLLEIRPAVAGFYKTQAALGET
jgi:hypothetical protein